MQETLNPLYEQLPQSLTVDGMEYLIYTDFREWIRFIDLAQDAEISQDDKPYYYLAWYAESVPEDRAAAINALSAFLSMEGLSDEPLQKSNGSENRRVLSYRIDAPYILSGFLECYGIDLTQISYMHWWMFQMLLAGLREDTEIKQRIAYRSVNLSEVKNKSERKRIQKIQKKIALPQGEVSDYDIGNAFV